MGQNDEEGFPSSSAYVVICIAWLSIYLMNSNVFFQVRTPLIIFYVCTKLLEFAFGGNSVLVNRNSLNFSYLGIWCITIGLFLADQKGHISLATPVVRQLIQTILTLFPISVRYAHNNTTIRARMIFGSCFLLICFHLQHICVLHYYLSLLTL